MYKDKSFNSDISTEKINYSTFFSTPKVMGILNITNNSFYDGGKYINESSIIKQCKKMIEEGVDIIDIGACSSKPGSSPVEEKKEIEIIKKYTKLIKQKFPKIIVSVDTFRSSVAEIAIKNNADIINDISAGKFDSKIFDVVAKNNLPYILMHMQGEPKSMQEKPFYKNIITELLDFFEKKINFLNKKGIKKIIIDPGFGFGKSLENNYTILKNLEKFQKFGYPVIAGVSRKSMLTKLLNIDSKDALNSTTIVNTIAVRKGCKVLRVHDVKQAKEILKILEYLKEK